MWIAHSREQLKQELKNNVGRVALVPTMGALHAGHASLIRRAGELGEMVVVSLFVNPTQFGPREDLSRYPRTFEADAKLCRALKVDGLFSPAVEDIYPPNEVACELTVPALSDILEGQTRPGHFAGVCRVVAKLFELVRPAVACFGQKDYQQLAIIRAMTTDLCMPVQIETCPTIRDAEGLALSSRNRYLTESGKYHALGLHKALREAHQLVIEQGELDPRRVEQVMVHVINAHHIQVDYAVIRHRTTLASLDSLTSPSIALVAGLVENIRLIDNMLL